MDGPPPPEEDFSVIPLADRLVHKNWKARVHGYEAITKLFQNSASDTDPVFRPYTSNTDLLKKFVTDSNAVAQEKGVEAVLALVKFAGETATKTHDPIVPALVDKCLGSTRAGTKAKAIELLLEYIEVENGGAEVMRDLLPGLNAKQPKAVAGCVSALHEAIRNFGPKVIPPKEILKTLPKIFGHTDKTVRAEGTSLVTALYTFLGPALQPFLADLKPVQVKELQESFDALDKESKGQGTGQQQRWTREQARQREAAELAGGDADGGAEEAVDEPTDPRALMEEVDITSKIPSDFQSAVASSSWKDRKATLEAVLEVVKANLKIKDAAAIGEVAAALAKRMGDANIQCVMLAANVIETLSQNVGPPFGKYQTVLISPMLERLKERKQNVVDTIGQGLDGVFSTTTLPEVTETILTTLKSKNPQVKDGTLKFLVRSLSSTKIPPAKGDIKPLSDALVGLLEDGYEPCRAAAAEGLGTLMKITGERMLNASIDPLDDLRKAKVKEAFEKATVKCKFGVVAPPPKAAPAAGPSKKKAAVVIAPDEDRLMNDVDATPRAKPPARLMGKKAPALAVAQEEDETLMQPDPPKAKPPARLLGKKPPQSPMSAEMPIDDEPPKPPPKPPAKPLAKKPPAIVAPPAVKKLPSAPPTASASKSKGAAPASESFKYKFTPEDAEAMAAEAIPQNFAAELGDGNWKIRMAGVDTFKEWLEPELEGIEAEVLFRFLGKKPGWNEKNFQVSSKVYAVLSLIAELSPSFTKGCVALATGHLAEKLGDAKLKKPAGETLTTFAEKTSLSFVLSQAYDALGKQKAPKVLADSILWIGQAVTEFGIAGLSLRGLIDFLKTALQNSNAQVRSSATSTLVIVKLFAGAGIKDFLEDLNPQLLATIENEFAKVEGQAAPVPTRTSADVAAAASQPGGSGKGGADPMDDLFPRQDLDKLIAGTKIIAEGKSDAWKTRKEALELLQSILDVGANKRLKPNMGDISQVLKARVSDQNKIVQSLALDIIARIATGMNKPFEKYCRILVAPVAGVLADQKANIRAAAVTALDAIATACESIDSMVQPIASALESTNPILRSSLLSWMGDWLKAHELGSHTDLSAWSGPVVSALEDRNGDVRKAAQAILPFVVASAGYDHVVSQTNSMKAASRASVLPMIQAARASAPSLAPPPATSHRANGATSAAPSATPSVAPSVAASSRASTPPPEPVPTKRAPTNLRMRKLDPASSRPESQASEYGDPPPSAGLNGNRLAPRGGLASRPLSTISPQPSTSSAVEGLPLIGSNLDAKRNRLARDGPRWIVEGLPVRRDLVETLNHQMEVHATAELKALLFSKDFNAVNDFVKGLAMVSDCYAHAAEDDESDEARAVLVANSDLALKYVSMRIHEPQPNLIVKCLDVLDNVVALLAVCDYSITDGEALCFVPTIVFKLGDGRETVRLRVQAIFQNLSKVYPSSKLFHLLLEHGLKAKVAKTRQGTLDELGVIIKRSGMSVCDPAKSFPVIASLIADKDPSVRKSALGALSEGYVLIGEKVWSYVGALSPKDKTQLEERLKRTSGPSRPVTVVETASTPTKNDSPVPKQLARLAPGAGRPASPAALSRVGGGGLPRPASPATRSVSGPASPPGSRFARPPSISQIEDIPEAALSPTPRSKVLAPSRLGPPRPRPNSVFQNDTSRSAVPSMLTRAAVEALQGGIASEKPPTRHDDDRTLVNNRTPEPTEPNQPVTFMISAILSADPARSVDALKRIQEILAPAQDGGELSPMFAELSEHTDGLIGTVAFQMSQIFQHADALSQPGNFRLAKHLIQTLNSFCDHPILAQSLPVGTMKALLEELTSRLLQSDESTEPNVKELSRFVNMIVLRIFTTGRPITIFRALFDLLLQITMPFPSSGVTANSNEAKLAELVLKCIWKMARNMPTDMRKGALSPVELFPAIEKFLQSVPPNEWRSRAQRRIPAGDMPLRTIKVIVQHIVAQYGDDTYDHLSNAFEDPSATIVYPYVYRILNTTVAEERTPENGQARSRIKSNGSTDVRSSSRASSRPSSRPASPSAEADAAPERRRNASVFAPSLPTLPASNGRGPMYNSEESESDPDTRLIEIIGHISDNTTGALHQQGITELHNFIKAYPHKKPRVDKILEDTGAAFRKYIARSLASRAAEDEERNVAVADTLSRLEAVKRDSAAGSANMARRVSNPTSPSSIPPQRTSGQSEVTSDSDRLSRLHDLFNYQRPPSVVGPGHHRTSTSSSVLPP